MSREEMKNCNEDFELYMVKQGYTYDELAYDYDKAEYKLTTIREHHETWEASRATLETAGKEPGQSVKELVEKIQAGGYVRESIEDRYTFARGLNANQAAKAIQSHVDQQTRVLRDALEGLLDLVDGEHGPQYSLEQDAARAALSTGNNLEVEKNAL